MAKSKLKPLLPSLRERKRYLAYEIISKESLNLFVNVDEISEALTWGAQDYLGDIGMADAGLIILKDKYDPKSQKGLIRAAHKSIDNLRAALTFISAIGNEDVIVRSVGVSGIMKKAYDNYVAG